MDESFLEGLGLTKGEVRIYLSLLSLGQVSSGPIIAASKISSSKVYEILEKLMEKGLVSHVLKNNTKHFQATSPHKLQDYLEGRKQIIQEQQDQLNHRLPELLARFGAARPFQNAQIFLGKVAVQAMLTDTIADAKAGEQYLWFGGTGEEYADVLTKFYRKFALLRKEKGLVVKGIGEEQYRPLLQRTPHAQIRYVDFPTPSNIALFRDTVAIISWSSSPIGILITSQDISGQFVKFFHDVWARAER